MKIGQKIAVVTGAAAGIGRAIAQQFARDGALVILCDRNSAALQECRSALGGAHEALTFDLTDEAAIRAAVAGIAARHGRIDVLVNNAGIIDPETHGAGEVPPELLHKLLRTNLTGAWITAREVARHMIGAGGKNAPGGAIVNISSLIAKRVLVGRAPYAMSKAAILGMTRALACEWAQHGVRVNAVLPGYVDTALVDALARGGAVDRSDACRDIPLGRMGRPDEIAETVMLAASATYMTGAEITVDGGMEVAGAPCAIAIREACVPEKPVVVITGGAGGIGAATSDRFLADGARVVVLDWDKRALAALPPDRAGMLLDVTDDDAIGRAVAEIEQRYGRIDVLVNNAAIADDFRPTLEQSVAAFERGLAINLAAPFHIARHVVPALQRAGGGAIVNISSIAARGGLPRRSSYCGAKAGIETLTRALALEWAGRGIRVNAVAPGYIATPGVHALEAEGKRSLGPIRRRVPLGRLGDPAEIAEVIAFLSSNRASYMTGSIVPVDGGWSAFGDAGDASG